MADCSLCGKPFVVTVAHEEGRRRRYEDGPAGAVDDRDVWICDFDVAKALDTPVNAVNEGMRQTTCPTCHTQMV